MPRNYKIPTAIFSLAAVGVSLIGCGRTAQLSAPGEVSLKYVETSGSDLVFRLANNSSVVLTFPGSYRALSGSIEPSPSVVAMECWAAKSTVSDEEPFALSDGPQQASIAVSSAEQVKLLIPSAFALQHKGGRCRLRLKTVGGSSVESSDFEP